MSILAIKLKDNQYLFFLITFSIVAVCTIGFSFYFSFCGMDQLARITAKLALAYFALLILSLFVSRIVILFRAGLITLIATFCFYTFFTGGIDSPYVFGFIIPSLIPFFYKPHIDRYVFIGISIICVIVQFYLSKHGIVRSDLNPADKSTHSLVVAIMVFSAVYTYIILLRGVIVRKNKMLRNSLKEIRSTTQKLIESEKMASLGLMSAGVAHEINNPLNFIKGGAIALSMQLGDRDETKPILSAIEEGVNRVSSIINSMSHFSRSTEAMDEPCNIHETVNNCLIMLEHTLKYKVKVTKKYGKIQDPAILGNAGKLHQAILNIIANAEQAITESGSISVETSESCGALKLVIVDDGEGISGENLKKISDPFFTTKPIGQGTGLGLAIAYKIIKEHKGKIEVKSKLTEGTRFTISFDRKT